jgi:tetratricopeptide (TPR) repeat protein
LSLIADSLKKAIKEKSLNVAPGINLLKNLGSKSKSKFDPKEVKRFVFLIVIPAATLAYLLLANPFGPNRNSKKIKPPVVAKAPPVKPAPKPVPSRPVPPVPPAPPTTSSALPAKEPDNIPMIGPGMSEVTVPENVVEEFSSKPVPGPKKEPEETISQAPDQESAQESTQEPAQEESTKMDSKENIQAEAKPSMNIKPLDPVKAPEVPAKAPILKADKFTPPKRPGPDITKDSDHYFNRAIFYQQSRDWERALQHYSKAAKLNANNPDIYNNIGVIYKELRQYDQAIEEFLKAIDLNPEYAKPYNNIGVVYYAKKDFQGAIRNYQKATLIEPENLEALNNLAVVYKRTGQLERAKAVLNQALAINPAHGGTHYNLAVLYEGQGNIKSAIHFYQNFVELASSSHPRLSVQVKKHIEALK